MHTFEDYYEILQVHFLAEPEIIEAAYKKLARKYHPDVNNSLSDAGKMKHINMAYEILHDPSKRKDYDVEWVQKSINLPNTNGTPAHAKASYSLSVSPKRIRFKDLDQGEVKTAYFDIKISGSSLINCAIVKDSLPAWLEIAEIQPLSDDPLAERIHINVTGPSKGTKFDCFIPIKIISEETIHSEEVRVHVELEMKGPVLQIDRRVVEFKVATDVIPSPQTITLRNLGLGRIEGNLIPRQKWIKVSPRSLMFTDKRAIQIQIDTARLFVDIMGYIDVKINCCSDVIVVKASVSNERITAK